MKPKLLLHVCCGPCATEVVQRLKDEYEVVGFFYNPNIAPADEYFRRLAEVERLSALWHVLVDAPAHEHEQFLAVARGLELEPEGGTRCAACFELRLNAAAAAAQANGCSMMATTLTIGRNKRADAINPIGRAACAQQGIRFLEADWKKQDGAKRSAELARELGMYRQNYCGCEFSSRPRNRSLPRRLEDSKRGDS
jgi:epoxyqueuosine reductase